MGLFTRKQQVPNDTNLGPVNPVGGAVQPTTSNTTNVTLTNTHHNANHDHNPKMMRRGGGISGGMATGGRRFQPGHVLRHPFFLITYILAWPAWFTAFIGQCVSEDKLSIPNVHGPIVGVLWFAIFLQLVVNIHLFIALSLDALALHRFQLAVVTAILVPFAVNGVQFIYRGQDLSGFTGSGPLKAVGVGWLLLAMVDILWVLYLTSEEDSTFYRMFNALGDGGLSSPSYNHRNTFAEPTNVALTSSEHNLHGGIGNGNGVRYSNSGGYSVAPQHGGTPVKSNPVATLPLTPVGGQTLNGMGGATGGESYTARAKALYAYTASPDDPNEVSFGKGEILELLDSSGKWWQCKTSSGQVGIAPSNYLQLL